MEQNPRQQNELREETKTEVIREGKVCSGRTLPHTLGLKGFGFFLARKPLTPSPISASGSTVSPDPTHHPECSAQSP